MNCTAPKHIHEHYNTLVRDQELRDNTSSLHARVSRDHNLMHVGFLEPVGFTEVSARHCDTSLGRDLDVDRLFEPSLQIPTPLIVDYILKENQWQTWSRQTIKRSHAD